MTQAYCMDTNLSKNQIINFEIKIFYTGSRSNRISQNTSKREIVVFKKPLVFKRGGKKLSQKHIQNTYLGVILDEIQSF